MMMTPEREKRPLSISSVDGKITPSKRHKDLTFWMSEGKDDEKPGSDTALDTQQDFEMLTRTPDCATAQQLLVQTVEDRVASVQPLRNPDWVNQVWTSLHVPAVLELAMHLNLTVDALATWVKSVNAQFSNEVLSRGAALVVEVVTNLPPCTIDPFDEFMHLPNDEILSKNDNEVETLVRAENEAGGLSAYARAHAAKSAIESLSLACKTYMDRLAWFKEASDKNCKESAEVSRVLEVLSQKLTGLVDVCARDVKEAECTLCEAKEKKETQSLQIVEFVHQRRQELLEKGETEACATLDSVVGIWKNDDVNVQTLWSARRECERQVEESERTVIVAEQALTFHKNVQILYRKARAQREKALTSSSNGLNKARDIAIARATAALEHFVPMLARVLGRYYEFHSIQQSKAKEELHEQEAALAAHNEYFGDSAPIKKGDIEQRIREFLGVTQSSMHEIMEIADRQRQLWEDKQTVLPQSVRSVLLVEFKALWVQLSRPMQDVMKTFVAAIEDAAGGAVAVQVQQKQQPEPAITSPGFAAVSTVDEQVFSAFKEPAFLNTHVEAITPYRTAISAVVAKNETTSSPNEEMKHKTWISALPKVGNEKEVAPLLPRPIPTSGQAHQKFEIGSTLYSKITAGESCTHFVRGVVVKCLSNDMYLMQYDNGDKFSVGRSFLFTKELMEQNLMATGVAAPDQGAEMEDAEQASSKSVCVIM